MRTLKNSFKNEFFKVLLMQCEGKTRRAISLPLCEGFSKNLKAKRLRRAFHPFKDELDAAKQQFKLSKAMKCCTKPAYSRVRGN